MQLAHSGRIPAAPANDQLDMINWSAVFPMEIEHTPPAASSGRRYRAARESTAIAPALLDPGALGRSHTVRIGQDLDSTGVCAAYRNRIFGRPS